MDKALSVLLSQVLVAFTIELDNVFEAEVRKTYARPFMASYVMWSNLLRHVDAGGTPVAGIVERSCTPKETVHSTIGGMERWGYLCVDHDPADGVPPRRKDFGSGRGIKDATVIHRSMVGELAHRLWEPLAAEIEARWTTRLGEATIGSLRERLAEVVAQVDLALPRFYPVISGGWFAHEPRPGPGAPDDDLPALLSRVLLAFTLDHERGSSLPLPLGQNVLRVTTHEGVPVRDLPLAAGISKEAVAMSLTALERLEAVTVEQDPNARGKIVRLTSGGNGLLDAQSTRLRETEAEWENRFGAETTGTLRATLQDILDRPGGPDGPLSAGLVTPAGGWRSEKRYARLTEAFIASPAAALPHHAMVLHRGGWPDGS